MFQVQNLRIKDSGHPVSSKDKWKVKTLKAMDKGPLGVVGFIVVEQNHGFGTQGIGILGPVVGKGVVSPMLFHPQPLGSANEISTQSVHVVDPWSLGGSSVVGIVLDVQSNEGLRDSIDNGKSKGSRGGHPQVLQSKEKTHVENGSNVPSPGSKFTTTADNLEDFTLDFTFEFSVKLVFAGVIWDSSNSLHLFQMLACMVRVDHFVLNGNIVSTKHMNGFTSWMIKVLDIVDGSINANFRLL
mmetsp:Transcript_16482/g.40255  ORF Transcript_16482/g.40255 Transcript_16482/m.40255 type:complete len:242 (-) Transcript_16482:221-946(-)